MSRGAALGAHRVGACRPGRPVELSGRGVLSGRPAMNADVAWPVVVLGPGSSGLHRTLGPMSWVALEEHGRRSCGIDRRLVADISVRSLAMSSAMTKDTAARALARTW